MTFQLNKNTRRYLSFFLFILPFFLYWNALNNEYAIDDNIVVDGVVKIENGFASIPEIFTTPYSTDSKQSFGYRPMASLSFAVEKQFFSNLPAKQTVAEKKKNDQITQANISHFVNVLLYALTALALLYVLRLIFSEEENKLLPYLIVFLFIILPIHTEPVNNIKSRDTLLMFLGVLGAISGFLNYAKKQKVWPFLFALFCVLFALFSKKSTAALVGIVPVILYYTKTSYKKIGIATLGVIGIIVVGFLLKKILLPVPGIRNFQYFENPLLTDGNFFNRIATGFYSLFFYLKMLVWPKEFSFYYGFSKIPLIDFSYYQVWLGILIFVPLTIYGILKWWKRDKLGLGILLWIGTLFGFINILFPIVGVVAERFAYLPSLGFSIVVGVLIFRVFKLQESKDHSIKISKLCLGFLIVVLIGYGSKIWARNPDWENYIVLFQSDIGHLQNSAKANVLLATRLYATLDQQKTKYQRQQVIKQTEDCFRRALKVYPEYDAAINNLAFIDIKYLGKYKEGIELLKRVEDSGRGQVIYNLAYAYYKDGQYEMAIPYLIEAIKNEPGRQIGYDNLFDIAKEPEFQQEILSRLEEISPELEDQNAIFDIKLGGFYYKRNETGKALYYYKKGLKLDPENDKLRDFVEQLEDINTLYK